MNRLRLLKNVTSLVSYTSRRLSNIARPSSNEPSKTYNWTIHQTSTSSHNMESFSRFVISTLRDMLLPGFFLRQSKIWPLPKISDMVIRHQLIIKFNFTLTTQSFNLPGRRKSQIGIGNEQTDVPSGKRILWDSNRWKKGLKSERTPKMLIVYSK